MAAAVAAGGGVTSRTAPVPVKEDWLVWVSVTNTRTVMGPSASVLASTLKVIAAAAD